MNIAVLGLLLYGFLLLIGGIIGYIKSDSLASLIMGTSCSFLVSFAALAILSNKEWGYYLAQIVVTALFLFFAYRFSISFKVMPGGILALLSLATCLLLFFKKG